jgi:hypothetical protein
MTHLLGITADIFLFKITLTIQLLNNKLCSNDFWGTLEGPQIIAGLVLPMKIP